MELLTESGVATLGSFPRFGDFVYREADVIAFPWGMAGFKNLHRWLFLTLDSQPSFVWLQSLDDVYVALPAANPWMIFEDYDPVVPAGAFAALRIANADDFTYLCTVTVSPGATRMTMNLASPIVVNLRTREAVQVTLETGGYSDRAPIPRRARTGISKGVQ